MLSWPLLWTLTGIGLAGSFLSGLLGVGGAAFIVPMLLYVPPLFGTGQLDIRMATGMSIVLVFVSAASSGFAHRHRSLACPGIARVLAPATAIGSLAGGLLSGTVPAIWLSGLFGTLALVAGLMLFLPRPRGGDELAPGTSVTFPLIPGVLISLCVGFFAGLVGAGGAFMLVPLMIYVLGIPTRITVASAPVVVLVSALAGLVGKVFADQVPWTLSAFLVIGALPGAWVGAWFSERLSASHLRYVLGVLTTGLAIRVWVDLM
ncbi:MAG: sulfite exporter TauE/SafE family protein [Bacillota bacterium]